MKKLISLVGLTLYAIGLSGQSTVYHPFPDSNAVWNVSGWYGYPCQSGFGSVYYDNFYYFSGTQTIGATTYQVLYRIASGGTSGSGPCSGGGPPNSSGYFGGIRQDTARKLVFIKFSNCAEDTLYNFSKNIGENMTFIRCTGSGIARFTEQITSIDSVLVGSQYHKRFNTTYQSCIEGVGSTKGFDYMGYTGTGNTSLQCYQHINDFYPANTTTCSAPAGLNEIANTNTLSIIPNPASDKIIINCSEGITSVTICDLLGKIVVYQKLNSETILEVMLPTLSKGTYFVNIGSSAGNFVRKINITQ